MGVKCKVILKTGKRKGHKCGRKTSGSKYCPNHKKSPTKKEPIPKLLNEMPLEYKHVKKYTYNEMMKVAHPIKLITSNDNKVKEKKENPLSNLGVYVYGSHPIFVPTDIFTVIIKYVDDFSLIPFSLICKMTARIARTVEIPTKEKTMKMYLYSLDNCKQQLFEWSYDLFPIPKKEIETAISTNWLTDKMTTTMSFKHFTILRAISMGWWKNLTITSKKLIELTHYPAVPSEDINCYAEYAYTLKSPTLLVSILEFFEYKAKFNPLTIIEKEFIGETALEKKILNGKYFSFLLNGYFETIINYRKGQGKTPDKADNPIMNWKPFWFRLLSNVHPSYITPSVISDLFKLSIFPFDVLWLFEKINYILPKETQEFIKSKYPSIIPHLKNGLIS